MTTRRKFSADFKAKVALEALAGALEGETRRGAWSFDAGPAAPSARMA